MDVATHATWETKVAFDSSFDAKEQVRQAIDIVDLLGKYNLQLRRQGRGFVAHCPWHDDTRPAFRSIPSDSLGSAGPATSAAISSAS